MTRLVLGVVGHVDHGKTALVAAVTGTDTDRLPEEKRRGISIALGFAHARIGGAEVDFIDAPGHERFVRTLIGGVTGADAVLLTVAANEGVKPQTREHLTIAALLGVRRALIVVTKADIASPSEIAAAGGEASALARELGLEAAPAIAVCALTGAGLGSLREAISALAFRVPPPADDGFAYLPLDRGFLVAGQGVVVTGTLRRGRLQAGEAVELLPDGRPVRIRGLQVHGKPVDVAEPGQRVAVNLRGLELADAPRGTVLASAGELAVAEWIDVELRAAPDAPPLANNARLSLLVGMTVVTAAVRLLDRDSLAPGLTALAQLRTAEAVAVAAGDGFVLRLPSPAATVAGGRVLDPQSRRHRRRDPARLKALEALAAARGLDLAAHILSGVGARGITVGRLAQLAGVARGRILAAAEPLGAMRLKGDVLVIRSSLGPVQSQLVRALGAAAGPMAHDDLAKRLPGVAPAALDAVLAGLAADGRVRLAGGQVERLQQGQKRAEARAEAEMARRFDERLRAGGLQPPDLLAEAQAAPARRALQALIRNGAVIRAFDRVQKREVLFHREAVEAARRRLAPLLASPGLRVSDVGQILGVSRKFSVPLLEHLDAVRFTRRDGDRRVLLDPADSTAHGGD